MSAANLLKKICGCCAGIEVATPSVVDNRPGLSAISYRIGTHGQFHASMLARLSDARYPILRNLKTRAKDDFGIALLDAWAVVCDILTFYQERLANESYLGTAKERFSLMALAQLIGYQFNPGVSSATQIAFTMETLPPGSTMPITATIPTGTRLQSTPGQDELPQVFETDSAIEARLEWNAIKPLSSQSQAVATDMGSVILSASALNIAIGDRLLIKKGATLHSRLVSKVDPDPEGDTTRVDFDNKALSPSIFERPAYTARASVEDFVAAYGSEIVLTQTSVDNLLGGQWRNRDLATLAQLMGWDLEVLQSMINATTQAEAAFDAGEVHIFRKSAQIFGYNAPQKITYPVSTPVFNEWSSKSSENGSRLYLDGEFPECSSGGYIYIQAEGSSSSVSDVYEINTSRMAPRSAYGISAKSTRLILTTNWWSPQDTTFMAAIRGSKVWLASEALPLAKVPIMDEVQGDAITLDGAYLFLEAGQSILVSGERTDVKATTHAEVVVINDVLLENGRSVIELQDCLAFAYHRDTVSINANVAPVSHGETVTEILGSGDGTKAHQCFALKQFPLTYTTASAPSGAAASLKIRVDDILWQEVATLYGRGAKEQVYTLIHNDDGTTTVLFGDGINGARLPTGINNIRADYRKGLGTAGNLVAEQIDQLLMRPLGIKGALNPVKASGGNDAETADKLRTNAPLTTLTLDRVVSLDDYQNFAQSFSGIAKAQAVWFFYAGRKQILLTIGGPSGAAIDAGSETHTKLLKALHDYGDPFALIKMATFRAVDFRLAGNLFVDERYEDETVLAAVKGALLESFRYDRRLFGQAVFASEVIQVIQGVDGVLAVDLDELYRGDQAPFAHTRLLADPPHLDQHGSMLAAELITIDPLCLDDLGVLS
jgi:hypothetical protein